MDHACEYSGKPLPNLVKSRRPVPGSLEIENARTSILFPSSVPRGLSHETALSAGFPGYDDCHNLRRFSHVPSRSSECSHMP